MVGTRASSAKLSVLPFTWWEVRLNFRVRARASVGEGGSGIQRLGMGLGLGLRLGMRLWVRVKRGPS